MDTNGIKMLKSIRMAFDLFPSTVTMNKVTFVKESIEKSFLIDSIKAKKCPVVHTMDMSSRNENELKESLHIMVATGVRSTTKKTFIQCKNSYRNNQGNFSYDDV